VQKSDVCLTIDDGWSAKIINDMLNVLRKYDVKCTFFVIGSRLNAIPEVWRKAVQDGHEICYHTMNHQNVLRMSNKEILADIKKWENAAHKALGKDYVIPKLARLPGGSGSSNQRILKVYASAGYRVVYWSMDTLSYKSNIVSYIKKHTKGGAVILTHFNSYDHSALPKYISWLSQKFNLCKLSEALAPS
jgi:peptidoglycan-N-acetylmuramic acid deacetylase